MKKQIISAIILLGFTLLSPIYAKQPTIQQRLANLEKLVKQQQPESRGNNADLIMQNQQLQQQIAELKGVIEEQNHQIKSLKDKQKLLYIDLDSRLTELEAKNKGENTGIAQTTSTDTTEQAPLTVEVDENYGKDAVNTEVVDVQEPQLSSAQDEYDIAFAHLRAGRFLASARAFEDFIQKHPNHELTDNAYYWLGESYYVKRQYPQALSAFQTLTKKFPNSDKAPDSWLKIGYSYYEMDDLVKAEENLKKVVNDYPASSIARLAKNRLLQLHRDN